MKNPLAILFLVFFGWSFPCLCFVLRSTNGRNSVHKKLFVAGSLNKKHPSKKNLYDILGASPSDSRDALKKRYVELAKISHPDAVKESEMDFSEIAAAYKILSDPKQRQRYDRSLRAEELSENIAQFVSQRAAPVTEVGVEMLEKIAFPFLRRTTATTLASVQAAVRTRDFSKTLDNAVAAAVNAGRAVDQMELQEKAKELEEKAVVDYNESVKLQEKLQEAAQSRLQLTLHTQRSGLTSAEALLILEHFNQTASSSLWEKASSLMRCTVDTEIATLQNLETSFVEVQKSDSEIQEKYNTAVRDKLKAQTELLKAEQELEEARLRFEAAKKSLKECRLEMDKTNSEVQNSEAAAQKSSFELERLSVMTAEQSETTRLALRKRETNILNHLDPGYKIVPDPETEEENQQRLERLNELRQAEREMAQQAKYLEMSAAKQLSRSNKLKQRIGAQERLEQKKK